MGRASCCVGGSRGGPLIVKSGPDSGNKHRKSNVNIIPNNISSRGAKIKKNKSILLEVVKSYETGKEISAFLCLNSCLESFISFLREKPRPQLALSDDFRTNHSFHRLGNKSVKAFIEVFFTTYCADGPTLFDMCIVQLRNNKKFQSSARWEIRASVRPR